MNLKTVLVKQIQGRQYFTSNTKRSTSRACLLLYCCIATFPRTAQGEIRPSRPISPPISVCVSSLVVITHHNYSMRFPAATLPLIIRTVMSLETARAHEYYMLNDIRQSSLRRFCERVAK